MLEQGIIDFYTTEAEGFTDRVDFLKGNITQDTFQICTLIIANPAIHRIYYNPRWILNRTNERLISYIQEVTALVTDSNQLHMVDLAIDIASVPSASLPLELALNLGTIAVADEKVLASLDGIEDLDGPNAARILKRLFPLQRANRHQQ